MGLFGSKKAQAEPVTVDASEHLEPGEELEVQAGSGPVPMVICASERNVYVFETVEDDPTQVFKVHLKVAHEDALIKTSSLGKLIEIRSASTDEFKTLNNVKAREAIADYVESRRAP